MDGPSSKSVRELIKAVRRGNLFGVMRMVTSCGHPLRLLTATFRETPWHDAASAMTVTEIAAEVSSREFVNAITNLHASCRTPRDGLSATAKTAIDMMDEDAVSNEDDPVVVASRLHDVEILNVLLSDPGGRFYPSVYLSQRDSPAMLTPLSACLEDPRGFLEVAEILVCSGMHQDMITDALYAAASTCRKDFGPVEFLLVHGADLNEPRFSHGMTILAVTAVQNPRGVKALLQAGADPHVVDMAGNTLLHLACQGTLSLAVKTLIRNCQDLEVDAVNATGLTPFRLLDGSEAASAYSLKLLAECGATLQQSDLAPLYCSWQYWRLIQCAEKTSRSHVSDTDTAFFC